MHAATKIDLYKTHRSEYVTPRKPVLVNVGSGQYMAVDGQGAPGGERFVACCGALYAVAYTLKFTQKFAGHDYVICKLEGQWWVEDSQKNFAIVQPEEWHWKLLIRTPDFIAPRDMRDARDTLAKRGKEVAASDVHLETIHEGLCVQMLHVGPYEQESATIDQMMAFASGRRLRPHGRHHEIYLSDPRRVPPQRLKTILRQPVRPGPTSET